MMIKKEEENIKKEIALAKISSPFLIGNYKKSK